MNAGESGIATPAFPVSSLGFLLERLEPMQVRVLQR